MNKRTYTILCAIIAAITLPILHGCLSEPEDTQRIINGGSPLITNDSIGKIKAHSIEIFAIIAKQNGAKVDNYGFYIVKEGATDTININLTPEAIPEATPLPFQTTIDNLELNATYIIIPYAGNSQGITRGKEQKATTLNGLGYITTLPTDSIKGTSAIAGGLIEDQGDSPVTNYGIILSLNPDMQQADTIYTDSPLVDNTFTIKINQLDTNTTYHLQAFAQNAHGTFIGQTDSFTTQIGKPTLGELQIFDTQYRETSYTATILSQGDAQITRKGICWTIYPGIPTIDSISNTDETDNFSGTIENLTPGVHYVASSYATNAYGTAYSDTVNFITKNDYPIVELIQIFSYYEGGAFATAEIEEGHAAVVAGGFCWATHPEPTINDPFQPVEPINSVGEYSGAIYGLKGNTTYYVRAYVHTAGGAIGYSNTKAILTPPIFEEVAPFPGGTRIPNSIATFTAHGSINATYILGGDKGTDLTNELWAYNIGNSWDQMANFPGGSKKWQTAIITPNNVAYIFGGINNAGTATASLYCYKPIYNTWEEIRPAPDAEWPTAVHSAAGTNKSNNAYYIGGIRNETISNEVWVCNTNPDCTWERKNDFPVKQYKGIAISQPNTGTLYAGLGLTDLAGKTSEKRLWSYINKPYEDEWKLETTFPGEGQIRSAVYYKNTIYLIDDNGQLWRYDLNERTWKQKSQLPPSNRGDYQHTMFVLDNTIFIGFGPSYRSLIKYDYSWDN